jgi:hypothetical protein
MNNRIYKTISASQILIFTFSTLAPQLSYAATPTPTPTNLDCSSATNCPACDAVNNALTNPTPKPTSTTTYYDSSGAALTATSDILATKCAAVKAYAEATTADLNTTIAFSAAAGVCIGSCAAAMTGFGAPAAEAICTAADLGATGYDLYATMNFMMNGQPLQQALEVTTAVGGAGSSYLAYKGYKAGSKAAEEAAKKAEKQAGIATAKTAEEDAAEKAGKKAGAGSVCGAAVILAATAALKGTNYALNKKGGNSEANDVQSMKSTSAAIIVGLTAFKAPGSTSLGGDSTAASGGGTGITAAPLAANDPALKSALSNLSSGGLSAALAGAPGSLITSPTDIPAALNTLGTDMGSIGHAIASGSSPGAAIAAAMPDLPSSMKDMLSAIDKAAAEGRLTASGLPSAVMSSGGGAKGAGSSSEGLGLFGGMFGNKSGLSGGAPKELGFTKTTPTYVSQEGDIWHSGWNGSIFQIVTGKLNKSRDRIEQLEWQTPLNRALSGLSNVAHPGAAKIDRGLSSGGKASP